jgi:hypothetical protein
MRAENFVLRDFLPKNKQRDGDCMPQEFLKNHFSTLDAASDVRQPEADLFNTVLLNSAYATRTVTESTAQTRFFIPKTTLSTEKNA